MKSQPPPNVRGGRILVTGASGFVGRALVRALAEDGYLVRAGTRGHSPFAAHPGIETVRYCDFTETPQWEPILAGVDRIIHLAAIAHANGAIAAERYDAVNRLATLHLATAAARTNVKRFIYVSSIRAQTGASADRLLTEADAPAPTDAYGRSKLEAENAARSTAIPFTIVRPVVIYGPGVRGNMAAFIRAVGSPWPLPLRNFANRRSFLGVQNFVSALKFLLSAPAAIGQTYIVADPPPALPLCDLVAALRRAAGRPPRLLPVPPASAEFLLKMMRREDLWERLGANLEADPAKLIAAGWIPIHDTVAGLVAALTAQGAAGPDSGNDKTPRPGGAANVIAK